MVFVQQRDKGILKHQGHKAQNHIAKAKQQRIGRGDHRNHRRHGAVVCHGTGIGQR